MTKVKKETDDLEAMLLDVQEPSAPAEQTHEPPPGADAETGEKDEGTATPADPDFNDPGPNVPRRALEDERRKRQELQRQLDELTRTNQQPQRQPEQHQQQRFPERPDPWTDPEGAARYDQMMFQHQLFETRVVTSKEMMRMMKSDFDDVEKVFIEAARSDPYLEQQLVNHPMPAKYAYEQGKRLMLMREIGDDPTAYRQRIREELLAEMSRHQPSQKAPAAPAAPKSLANTTSAQPRLKNGQFAPGGDPLDEIFGG